MYSLSVVPGLTLDYLGRLGDIEEDLPLRSGSTRPSRDAEAITSIHDDAQTEKRMIPRGFRGGALSHTSHRRENITEPEPEDNQSGDNSDGEGNFDLKHQTRHEQNRGIARICHAIRTWFLRLFRRRSNIRQSDDETTLDVATKVSAFRMYSMDSPDIHCI
ncbi:hypothetical protein QE152_g410 [Popillia japonica]|uniref:Uncharacterized protein n=1 Tax=Popillia japonica TaxID=7064 RepID=A0AAW1NJL1_POPJA